MKQLTSSHDLTQNVKDSVDGHTHACTCYRVNLVQTVYNVVNSIQTGLLLFSHRQLHAVVQCAKSEAYKEHCLKIL